MAVVQKIGMMQHMDQTLIAIIIISIVQLATVAIICHFMHKNTLSIAAFKRASSVAEASALLAAATERKETDENEDEQQETPDFATLPTDMNTEFIRTQI